MKAWLQRLFGRPARPDRHLNETLLKIAHYAQGQYAHGVNLSEVARAAVARPKPEQELALRQIARACRDGVIVYVQFPISIGALASCVLEDE